MKLFQFEWNVKSWATKVAIIQIVKIIEQQKWESSCKNISEI